MTEFFYFSARDFLSDTRTIASEQVMSPSSQKIDDANKAQAPPTTSHERAASDPAVVVPPHVHERSADTNALERVLNMLSGMDERMKKMELYQAKLDEDERMQGVVDSGMFGSMLGADFAGRLHRDALECSELPSHQSPRHATDRGVEHRPRFQHVRRSSYSCSLNRLLNFRRTSRGRYRSTKSLPNFLRRLSTGVPTQSRESLLYASLTGLKCTSH